MNVLQTIDLKKYYGSEPNNEIAQLANRIVRTEDGRIVEKLPKSQLGGGRL